MASKEEEIIEEKDLRSGSDDDESDKQETFTIVGEESGRERIIESEPEKGSRLKIIDNEHTPIEEVMKNMEKIEIEPLKPAKLIKSEESKGVIKNNGSKPSNIFDSIESEPSKHESLKDVELNSIVPTIIVDTIDSGYESPRRVKLIECGPVKTASQKRNEFRMMKRKQSTQSTLFSSTDDEMSSKGAGGSIEVPSKIPGGSIEIQFDKERVEGKNEVGARSDFGHIAWEDRTTMVTLDDSTKELREREDSIDKLKSKKKLKSRLLAGIKLYDMLFHVYLLTLSAYSLKLSTVDCLQVHQESVDDHHSPVEDHHKAVNANNQTRVPWSQETVVVMNAAKWSMSITDLLTILSVIHIVYAVISIISDYFYFRAPLITGHIILEGHGNPKTSYMTILSVQRLYFILVSTLDSFLLVSTSNISVLTDTVVLTLIVIINIIIIIDTRFINKNASAVFREGLCCQNPWRNLGILVANLAMGISNVAHGISRWTFAAVPNLSLCLLSCLLCIKLLCDNTCVKLKEHDKLDPIVYYLMSISAGNTLGLLVLSTILQKLTLNCL